MAALLDQLKASAAWQELEANATVATSTESPHRPEAHVGQSRTTSTLPVHTDNGSRPPNSQPATTDTPSSDLDETTPNCVTEAAPFIIAGTSVASLLSQLQPFNGAPTDSFLPPDPSGYDLGHYQHGGELPYPPPPALSTPRYVPAAAAPPTPSPLTEDRRNISFRESLPIISDLANDPSFVAKIRKVSLCCMIMAEPGQFFLMHMAE